MENGAPNVLLIEDNPGDADLVRLRLVEGKSDAHVNWVPAALRRSRLSGRGDTHAGIA